MAVRAMFSGTKGKYFHIKNKSNGQYLSVKAGSREPGALVQTWTAQEADHQMWYREPFTGTIRTKNGDLCLDYDESTKEIKMNKFSITDKGQQWRYNKDKSVIENIANPLLVLTVPSGSSGTGAIVVAQELLGKDNQKWVLEPESAKYFRIVSAHTAKVLDVEGGGKILPGRKSKGGQKVIMFKPHKGEKDNQLWYEDNYGNIRSKISDQLCLDASSGTLQTGTFVAGQPRLFWVPHEGNKIVNRDNPSEVLEVKGGDTSDGAELGTARFTGANYQLWSFEYV